MTETEKVNEPKAYKVWEPLIISIAVVIGMMAGMDLIPGKPEAPMIVKQESDFTLDDAEAIADVIRYIEAKYVDPVHAERLIEGAIQSVLAELDPHSSYISPDELREHNEKMRGNFDGVGIEFHLVKDTVGVTSVLDDGPAYRAGVLVGDRIIAVDDSLVSGNNTSSQQLVDLLRGKKGSKIKLNIYRHSQDTMMDIKVARSEIPIFSVPAAFMLNENTGFIKITRFSANTYKEFMMSMEELIEKEGMKHLVLDLRDNPGGYLNEAVNILSQFFDEKGKLLVYTEGLKSKRADYKTTGKPFFELGNIVVLINEGSASASEIVAGALQDQDRAIILGQQSYGKGLVQEHYPLPNGGALRLTIARYFTPSGRLIQTPYFLKDGKDTIVNNTTIPHDTTTYFTMNGREVFSDGGISPDFTIESPDLWEDSRLNNLYSCILDYAFYQVNEEKYRAYTSLDTFNLEFPSADIIAEELKTHCQAELDQEQIRFITANKQKVSHLARAMIASFAFDKQAWYQVLSEDDDYINQAMTLISEDRKVTLKID